MEAALSLAPRSFGAAAAGLAAGVAKKAVSPALQQGFSSIVRRPFSSSSPLAALKTVPHFQQLRDIDPKSPRADRAARIEEIACEGAQELEQRAGQFEVEGRLQAGAATRAVKRFCQYAPVMLRAYADDKGRVVMAPATREMLTAEESEVRDMIAKRSPEEEARYAALTQGYLSDEESLAVRLYCHHDLGTYILLGSMNILDMQAGPGGNPLWPHVRSEFSPLASGWDKLCAHPHYAFRGDVHKGVLVDSELVRRWLGNLPASGGAKLPVGRGMSGAARAEDSYTHKHGYPVELLLQDARGCKLRDFHSPETFGEEEVVVREQGGIYRYVRSQEARRQDAAAGAIVPYQQHVFQFQPAAAAA
jgi:hypothetical protein